MGYFGYYIASTVFLLIYLGLTWLVTDALHLTGSGRMMAEMMFMMLGFGGYGYLLYYISNRQSRKQAEAAGQKPQLGGRDEISYLVKQAEARLGASQLGRHASLGTLPVIFLLGETGAAKTSIFVHSSLDPDLLVGQVYQDQSVIPTRPANFWLGRRSVFVEAGGGLLGDPLSWMKLIRSARPRRMRNFLRRQPLPSRAAVVCVDAETFLRPGADEALAATARNLNARLGEISQTLGIPLPFYVLFTKLDRLNFFSEFVGNLTEQEVYQVLGATLAMREDLQHGVWAEEESRRLTASFSDLVGSLCDKRPPFLLREHDEAKLPKVYEFPREFRKLRKMLVRFLVDVGKPSQLRVNPFLRGYYFSGVRPVVINEAVPVRRAAEDPAAVSVETPGMLPDADMEVGISASAEAPRVQTVRTRRIPQWLFLGHLFGDVVLRDSNAMVASGESASILALRRSFQLSAIALLIAWGVGMTVSWSKNRALEAQVDDAARGIAQGESGGAQQQLPSLDALQRLDHLRESMSLIFHYNHEGAPWSYRWGLYEGEEIYPPARKLYFNRFAQLLFGATQASLLDWLRKLPAKPGPNDDYKYTYDTLRAYLITTSFHEKSTRQFLSPLLMERWAAGREIEAEVRALAQRQFDFYSDELAYENPFSKFGDNDAIEHARRYLHQFNASESIYQFMLADASQKASPVNFNKQFPGSAAYVVNNKDVPGAFSAKGFGIMQENIRNMTKFFGGERWVLGEGDYGALDPLKVGPELEARYRKDFIANWRAYLFNTEVVRYGSVADAAHKLAQLSSNQSYLLAMFCVATENTIDLPDEFKAPYQPVHQVEPKGCMERFVSGTNAPYMTQLGSLQVSMDRVAKTSPPDESLAQQTENDAAEAYKATRQIAQGFRIDTEGHVHQQVQKLMEDPIRYAEAVLGRLGPAQLNSEGKALCGQFGDLAGKYPFNTASKVDATMAEVEGFFRPGDGRLAVFYDSSLKNYLEKRGNEYFRKPDSKVQITDSFLRFFNRAMAFSDALYHDGRQPRLSYVMKTLPAEGLTTLTLTLDGQVLKGTGKGGESKEFVWPGTGAHEAHLSGNLGQELGLVDEPDGLWAVFRFFGDADRFEDSRDGYVLEWVPRLGQANQPMRLPSGHPLTASFLLDLKGAPKIFQKGYLSGMQCVSEVAR